MDHSHDDEGLWDELNNQQSREIQEHENQRRDQTGRWRIPPAVENAIRQTAGHVSAAVSNSIGSSQQLQQQQDAQYESLSSLLPPGRDAMERELGMNIFGRSTTTSRQEPLLSTQNAAPPPPSSAYPTASSRNRNSNSSSSNNNNQQYVFLQPFRLLPRRDGWGAVANLDVFFSSLYSYYYHRGLTTIVMKGFVELVSLFFTLWLSIVLFAYVDWSALTTCKDEATCHDHLSSYLVQHPWTSSYHSGLFKAWMLFYILIFLAYGSFSVWSLWHNLQEAMAAKQFFEDQLGIGEHKLQGGAVDWDKDVVAKIVQLQQSGQYRVAIHGQADETMDALVVAQRILRKENFLIALFNNPTILDFTVPISGTVFFSKSLEWSLYFCVLNFMFNRKYQLRPAFYLDPSSLKKRFILCGVAHIIFMPFVLFFMTLHFSLQHAYDWKSTKQYLGPREWSLAAKWTFREFNELPHLFERRMGPSYDAAESYLKLFRQNEIVTALGRLMVFVGGSLGAVLFALAAMNDAILLHVKIADWNLLWYAGVVAGIYSTGKAMMPAQENKDRPLIIRGNNYNLFQEMDNALGEVAKHTHYFPNSWKGRGWDKRMTYKAFSNMFQYKAKLFGLELASVVVAPFLLCVSLPRCAERICDFILAIRAEVPGAGDVCGFGTFDFDTFGDELWEGRTMGRGEEGISTQREQQQQSSIPMAAASLSESIMQTGNVAESTRSFPKPKAYEGKMEKSFFSFKAAHPSWKCSRSGQDLVDRLEQYQQNENVAISRERQLYIEAAARQLETLAQLEQQKHHASDGNLGRGGLLNGHVVDESYIRNVPPSSQAATADAGAGSGPNPHEQLSPNIIPTGSAAPNAPPKFDQGKIARSEQRSTSPDQLQSTTLPFAAPSPLPLTDPHIHTGQHLEPMSPTSRMNLHSTSFANSNSLAPPPSIFPPPTPATVAAAPAPPPIPQNNNAASSQLHLNSLGLSTELRRILNMSTLDPDASSMLTSSNLTGPLSLLDPAARAAVVGLATVEEERDRATEQQIMLLERYHSHNMMTSRQQQFRPQQQGQPGPPHQAQNLMPASMAPPPVAHMPNANGTPPSSYTGTSRTIGQMDYRMGGSK